MPAPDAGRSPRSIITEDALSVHPSMLGLPLAPPWRRAAAMAVDGILIAILANAPGVLFALAAALLLFRASAKASSPAGYFRKSVRLGLRASAAAIIFAIAVAGWDSATDRLESGIVRLGMQVGGDEGEGAQISTSARGAVAMASGFVAMSAADDAEEARTAGQALVERMRGEGAAPGEIEGVLEGVAEGSEVEKPWMRAVVDTLVAGLGDPSPVPVANGDSLAAAYAAAVGAGDSAGAAELRPLVARTLAADTLAALGSSIEALRGERDELRGDVAELQEAARNTGIVPRLRSLADDLGLGLGWAILYFTATVAMWRGRTVGKRLLGIRVVRLNARPIGWWAAFERAGGYWAGFATGLLGFFQILWDKNRQAIHDKITETAVVRDA